MFHSERLLVPLFQKYNAAGAGKVSLRCVKKASSEMQSAKSGYKNSENYCVIEKNDVILHRKTGKARERVALILVMLQ